MLFLKAIPFVSSVIAIIVRLSLNFHQTEARFGMPKPLGGIRKFAAKHVKKIAGTAGHSLLASAVLNSVAEETHDKKDLDKKFLTIARTLDTMQKETNHTKNSITDMETRNHKNWNQDIIMKTTLFIVTAINLSLMVYLMIKTRTVFVQGGMNVSPS